MHQSTDHIFYKLAVNAMEELITIYCDTENKNIFTHLMKNRSGHYFSILYHSVGHFQRS